MGEYCKLHVCNLKKYRNTGVEKYKYTHNLRKVTDRWSNGLGYEMKVYSFDGFRKLAPFRVGIKPFISGHRHISLKH